MSTLRRLSSGRWQARYVGPDGVQRSAGTWDTKTRAVEEGKKAELGLRRSENRGDRLDTFYDDWRAGAVERGRPSERTLIEYDRLHRLFIKPKLGRRRLSRITRANVVDVVSDAAQVSPYRAADTLKVLRMILNRAVAEERITRNPAAGVTAPRLPRIEPTILTPADVERLADAVGERWRALVLLLAYTSLRWSEAVALRVDRLDLMRRRVRVEEKLTESGSRLFAGEPKTERSRRAVALPESVALELAEHLRRYPPGPGGLVFHSQRGQPVRRSWFYKLVWKPATIEAGLEGFRLGQLRHTGASLAIAAGANPRLVADRLGHTSTRMVDRTYVSMFEGLDTELARSLDVMRASAADESKRLRPPS